MLAAIVLSGATAAAGERSHRVSLGYAPSYSLGEHASAALVGGYVSLGSMRGSAGIEVELAYRRDTHRELDTPTSRSWTSLGVGPRLERSGKRRVFCRALLGPGWATLRTESGDSIGIGSSPALAFTAGGGLEVPAGPRAAVRLAADFQALVAGGGGGTALRMTAGIVF